ncbi:MAG: hypothetical protein OEZ06_30950 [Myxococcales bacterium]|nr:hypothetical protein [Myxococcales bacterium]
MAFLARRAVEQRLGEDLSLLSDDLPLVDSPSTWVDSVCATSGANLADTQIFEQHFADSFIGDYVTKLENIVESYRLINNFHEGSDSAIVSLRDDIHNVREECATPVDNLLRDSGYLDRQSWSVIGCEGLAPPDGGPVGEDSGATCVSVVPILAAPAAPDAGSAPESGPFGDTAPAFAKVPGYRVTFGDSMNLGTECILPGCLLTPDAGISQSLQLEAKRYRLSWYARDLALPLLASSMVHVTERESGAPLATSETATVGTEEPGDWNRWFLYFDVPYPQTVDVSIRPVGTVSQQIDVAALMLEDVHDGRLFNLGVAAAELPLPKPYVNADENGEAMFPVCEDTDGSTFREQVWTRRCVKLCPDGLRSDCGSVTAQTHCFREAVLGISQRDIEDGRIFALSGFARGNFNYRVESVGVNFVGTGTRDCENSTTPSTCYASGFIPYTIEHLGPYYVRNYGGSDFKAELFTGRIEHARGLAAERYLSNPLSSSDRDLIGPYLRQELRGRPLDGTFVLRVWEEEGVRFDGIEDVQLVLNYRYWTRFD